MLGLNIKAIREFKKISVQTVINRLAIFPKKYLEIERGIVNLDSNLLKKIANILGVSDSDIINYDSNIFSLKQKELNSKNANIDNVGNKGEVRQRSLIKPILLTPSDILKKDLSNQLYKENTFSAKDETDPFNFLIETDDKSFSPRLLNTVQPYFINGIAKTMFFSEFNTGLKVDSRVFITNGVYDSSILIKSNKYKRGRDGYKVLFIDKCKIVLDINYTGLNPWKQEDPIIGYSANLYYVKDDDDFKLVNRQITTSGGLFDNKFNLNKHNFIYVDKNYDSISGWGNNSGLIGSPGFFVRNRSNGWINVTNEFLSGSLNSVLSPNLIFNGRIKVIDGEFNYKLPSGENLFFEEGKTYIYGIPETEQETFPRWTIDTDYNRVFISRANFRNGIFKGEFNSGLFGNPETEAKWSGIPAKWNSGTLLNSFWEKGEFNSIFTLTESFFSEIDSVGNPVQKINGFNNNGRGYSLIVDSIVDNMIINNATIFNTYFGETASYDVVNDYVKNEQTEFNTIINRGFFVDCLFENSSINNSLLQNSKSVNSKLNNVRSVSSDHKNTVIDNSAIINDQTIRIIGYDELSMAVNSILNDVTHKVYKFYVNEVDFNRLKLGDYFYLQNLKVDNNPINFFDKKFRVSSWTEYVDFYSGDIDIIPQDIPNDTFYKRGIEVCVFLSTPIDNQMLYNSYRTSSLSINTISIEENLNKLHSIDIVVSTYDIDGNKIKVNDKFKDLVLDYNRDRKVATPTDLVLPNVVFNKIIFNDTYLMKGNIESGIVNDTDWNFGNNIESNKDLMISVINNIGGKLNINLNSNKKLVINLGNSSFKELKKNSLKIGQIVFLNSISYLVNNNNIKIGDTYKIISLTDTEVILEEVNSNILSQLLLGGLFITNMNNRYNYIHLSKFNDNNIKKGLFNRSYLTNNNIFNSLLNIEDKDFSNISNIKGLTVINSLFDNNNNILNKALYINCHFNESSNWEDGIIYKSVWLNGIFKKGLIKLSNWKNGTFDNGVFYQSNSFNAKPTNIFKSIEDNNIYSYFITGTTSPLIANSKWSWGNGTFNNGTFELSDYENGNFNNGNFIYSNFYNGVINGGVIGSKLLTIKETQIFNAVIENCTVINASLIARDTSHSNISKNITWKNGVFNSGVFGNEDNSTSIWENGTFNGGEFTHKAKWKNGTFNGGTFTSYFGLSNPIEKKDFTWEDGEFNGGIFGNSDKTENSTWFNGQFNNGKFVGRIWNNGIFTGGIFDGSGELTISMSSDEIRKIEEADNFVKTFATGFYGLWRNGLVSIEKDRFIKEVNVDNSLNIQANFKNILWINGTFSHSNGILENSVFLDGEFEKGTLLKSSFNPFVSRTSSTFGFSKTALWKNGHLKESDFYFSEWLDGKFSKGNAFGMIWNKGVNEYMNAFNIWWKDGIWKNGNWYGSFINYDGNLDGNDNKTLFYQALLKNINDKRKENKVHLWNVFEEQVVEKDLSSGNAGELQDIVSELVDYYGLSLCPDDNIVYYTNISPLIKDQRYVKNNKFYFYNNNSVSISERPDNFVDDLHMVEGATKCPSKQTYYEIESCDDGELYYTTLVSSLSNQRYIDNSNGKIYTKKTSSIYQDFQPNNFISVALITGQSGCSQETEPTTNEFIELAAGVEGTVFVTGSTYNLFLSGSPFRMTPTLATQNSDPGGCNGCKAKINFFDGSTSSADIISFTLGGTTQASAYTNLRIIDNFNTSYSGTFQNGNENIGHTTSNKIISFNIGPQKGRNFRFLGGEVELNFE